MTNIFSAFPKSAKKTLSFVMSGRSPVRLSVHMEQLVSHWKNFYEISKICWEIRVSLKYDNN
jgi:hypothetical protein